jgi:type IV secretory pathway TrbL component
MFNNLIAALAVTAFGLGAMPAKANTSHSYRVGFAGAVMHSATCSYISGNTTKEQAASKVLRIFRDNQIPKSYVNNPDTLQMAGALYAQKGC